MLKTVDQNQAQAIAISALSFIASDEKLLPRFLSLSGIDASQVRSAASEPGFLAGVLQFVAAHEPTLMAFSAETQIAPAAVMAAIRALPGGDDGYTQSP